MAALSSIFCFFVATGAGCEKVAASRFPAAMRNTEHNTWKQMITEQKKEGRKEVITSYHHQSVHGVHMKQE